MTMNGNTKPLFSRLRLLRYYCTASTAPAFPAALSSLAREKRHDDDDDDDRRPAPVLMRLFN